MGGQLSFCCHRLNRNANVLKGRGDLWSQTSYTDWLKFKFFRGLNRVEVCSDVVILDGKIVLEHRDRIDYVVHVHVPPVAIVVGPEHHILHCFAIDVIRALLRLHSLLLDGNSSWRKPTVPLHFHEYEARFTAWNFFLIELAQAALVALGMWNFDDE